MCSCISLRLLFFLVCFCGTRMYRGCRCWRTRSSATGTPTGRRTRCVVKLLRQLIVVAIAIAIAAVIVIAIANDIAMHTLFLLVLLLLLLLLLLLMLLLLLTILLYF